MAVINYPTTKKAKGAQWIVKLLEDQGFETYLAGGSVRDLLLGRSPKDYDIVTAATPEELDRLFPKILPVGRKFGISLVLDQGLQFEIATFRGEGSYSDQRRPDAVYWTSPKEDATRRDFTINALLYNPLSDEIFDYVDGLRDIEAKIVRFVGEPRQRVREDSLRMLRAVRLKNELGFQYDVASYRAIKQAASSIERISTERIVHELDRMWRSKNRATSLRELADLGLLASILPEIEALRGLPQPREYHHEGDVFEHTVRALAALPARVPTFLVWAVLFHDAGKAVTLAYPERDGDRIRFDGHKSAGARLAREVGVRLHLPRTEIETIAWLVDHHMSLKGIDTLREAKRRRYLLDPRFRWLLELHRADASGTMPKDLSLYREVQKFYVDYRKLWQSEQKIGQPSPLVTGDDLQKNLGIPPGPLIGQLLGAVQEAQLERKIHTKREALALARHLKNR